MKDLREIAEIEGLEYFETTSEASGYPHYIKGALKGFDTFEQAEEIAQKYDLDIQEFHKRDGQQLWSRAGWANRAFQNSDSDYGDNYSSFNGGEISEEEFFESEVKPCLENFDNFEDLNGFLKQKEELFDNICCADIDELVITYCGDYYETIKKESMYFYHDTKHYVIGLIDMSEED